MEVGSLTNFAFNFNGKITNQNPLQHGENQNNYKECQHVMDNSQDEAKYMDLEFKIQFPLVVAIGVRV